MLHRPLRGTSGDPVTVPERAVPLARRVLRDPLIHFLLIGLVLFLAASRWQAANDRRRIVLDQPTVERIAAGYRQRFGEIPSPRALRLAIADYVADEALYREGVAQGIDREDEIVRRRIIQKMRFIAEGRVDPPATTDAAARAFYAGHRTRYVSPPRVTFTHVYFATDSGDAVERAQAARPRLGAGDPTDSARGDPFPDRSIFTNVSKADIDRVFGTSGFAEAVLASPVGRWSPPLRSGMGVHLVRVTARTPAVAAPFDQVRAQVAADAAQAARQANDAAAVDGLVARYTVILPEGPR